jgi:hypothetical protein
MRVVKLNTLQQKLELLHLQLLQRVVLSNVLNDDNVIRYIQYLFEDITTAPKGASNIVPYEYEDGTVIVQNLPASTNVVKPVSQRVFNLDGYLRDVDRNQ